MNLKFKHVTAKNFLSFKQLDFNIEQFDGTTVLITGYNDDIQGESQKNNGAGKSTLNNTILFAIYGEVLNPLKKATSMRNWSPDVSPKDDVEVVLTLESGVKEYAIQRLLKGKKCAGELHVFSRENGTDSEWNEITLSTMAETQRMIETDIVPCGKEGFLRCVILTADQNYNFFKLNKAAKNSFFESLFELTKYSDMYSKLHRRTLDETASLTASSRSIDKFNANILKLEKDKEIAKKNQEDIINAEKELGKFKKELDDFNNDLSITKNIESIQSEYSEYKKTEIESMKRIISDFDSENEITETDNKHRIVFNSEQDNKTISLKMDEYDKKNGIAIDSSGNIKFENESEIIALEDEKNKLSTRIENGKLAIRNLNVEINSIEKTISSKKSEVDSINSKNHTMEATLKTHSKITDILCSDCIVKYMDSVDISNYPSLIEGNKSKIIPIENEIKELSCSKSENETLLEKYEKGLEILENRLSTIMDRIVDIKNDRKSIQSERDSYRKSIANDIETIHEKLQFKRDSIRTTIITEYKNKCTDYERKISDEKRAFSEKKESIERNIKNSEYKLKLVSDSKTEGFDASIRSLTESLEKEKEEFDKLTETISHYKALEEILKPENIRKSVVPDMLKELNFRICGYLSKMGSNYTCEFDDDFEATFVSSTGTEAEYNNFSSGEKMRLSIACCLAFRDFMQVRLNFHPNMLVIDEFIDSNLDPMAVNGIMDMIHFMVGTEKISAFIISHRIEIKQDVFDHEILIRKKNNDSKLIIDGIEN